jgi:hypothetical protein
VEQRQPAQRQRQGQGQMKTEQEKDPRRCFTTRMRRCFRRRPPRPTGTQSLTGHGNQEQPGLLGFVEICGVFNGAFNPFRRLRAAASGRRASFWKLLFHGCGAVEATPVHIVVVGNCSRNIFSIGCQATRPAVPE